MKRALVVGGTGMLKEATIWLHHQGYRVSVIGRSHEKMDKLIQLAEHPKLIEPLLVDYKKDTELKSTISHSIEDNGGYDLVIAWIHSDAPQALNIIIECLHKDKKWSLFHVLGSSTDLDEIDQTVKRPLNGRYHQVQLGFIKKGNSTRWLTHKEISTGVIDAIKNNEKRHVVGQL
ncbi:short-chain dehydrogenase [Halalkalibacillus sediminis]|uniref:Short-chain dehydrogenase n=1 Tax=Halalkalibacillus sediminis TaxID=2018042 RepID=A0A2I0QS68_9BACI|nr:short-chain dehydrogenase [Halalkalibacillus sediminis]PKR77158.1 short-chain dehydrogenase [Halalkalibacillus sediminis]